MAGAGPLPHRGLYRSSGSFDIDLQFRNAAVEPGQQLTQRSKGTESQVVRVQYFLIHAVTETAETDGREKRWFAFDEAISAVPYDDMRRLLAEAQRRIIAAAAVR